MIHYISVAYAFVCLCIKAYTFKFLKNKYCITYYTAIIAELLLLVNYYLTILKYTMKDHFLAYQTYATLNVLQYGVCGGDSHPTPRLYKTTE